MQKDEIKQKECPFCAENINAKAKKCKHCGEILDIVLRVAEEAKSSNNNQNVSVNVVTDKPLVFNEKEKSVGFLLSIGIIFLPFIFAWFTLRKGHTTKAKVISFIWMVFYITSLNQQ